MVVTAFFWPNPKGIGSVMTHTAVRRTLYPNSPWGIDVYLTEHNPEVESCLPVPTQEILANCRPLNMRTPYCSPILSNENLAFELTKQLWSSRPGPESNIRITRVTVGETREGFWTCTIHGKQGDVLVRYRLPDSVVGVLMNKIETIEKTYGILQDLFFQANESSGDNKVYQPVPGGMKDMDFEGTYKLFLTLLNELPLGAVEKALGQNADSASHEEAGEDSGEDDEGSDNSHVEGVGSDDGMDIDENGTDDDNRDVAEDTRDLGRHIIFRGWYEGSDFRSEGRISLSDGLVRTRINYPPDEIEIRTLSRM
ncbi:hypothetical protein TREMEDRAFT_61319 [Tremella mesenterica DSM 1558]|uniref:uncharacterized protein n=1 Tax=Tremella mesenterica (strain ATCC 24925 / CBS 8224 / DSM 1558 / NBRC 9311 / NRRL Y-6157 / RJB 2259-6 / UBC 559-6) TaxID=578456 RepID=UPI0003F49F2F|nr:uncharacterized protein TREMEDRAFT_61319 [Tremella mesenterica DSM 1558]EIW70811.1 hypothetical protein TREMEDRAFT_61319 [Tremella mesenterica DSM 1558]